MTDINGPGHGVVNDICADIHERLEGIADFALVIWLDGRPGDPATVCVASSTPDNLNAVADALVSALDVLGKD